jgi:hypothetical protein
MLGIFDCAINENNIESCFEQSQSICIVISLDMEVFKSRT